MELSQKAITNIGNLIRYELTPVEERISNLPTKDEFYSMMDRILLRLDKIEQEFIFTNHKAKKHDTRITALEKVVLS